VEDISWDSLSCSLRSTRANDSGSEDITVALFFREAGELDSIRGVDSRRVLIAAILVDRVTASPSDAPGTAEEDFRTCWVSLLPKVVDVEPDFSADMLKS
jgi:hypothetical protein